MPLKDFGLGGCEQAVKPPQHCEGQDHLSVFIALVWSTEEIADAPDEAGELGVGFVPLTDHDVVTELSAMQARYPELAFLHGRRKLRGVPVFSIVRYE